MGIELVTGFTGKAHISSLDVAKFNAGALGPGEYVFAGVKDDKLKATMASSNKVHISSGNAMMQGRHFWVDAAGVDLTVQTGTQSQKRNDLVVARYAKNASTGVESVSLVVIKGTPTTGTPADPSYTRGDILNGNALTNDMPLWRIPLNGITVGTPVQLFQEFTSAKDAWNSVSQVAETAPATGTGKVRFVRYGALVVGFANVSGTSIGTSGAKLCVIPEMARPRSWQRLPISGDSVNAAAEVSSDGTMKVWSMEAEKTLTRLISTFSYYLI